MKKRPRGLFTYTGLDKYNDGRKDLRMTLAEQFLENVEVINQAVFNNGQDNKAYCGDALSLDIGKLDLVYIEICSCIWQWSLSILDRMAGALQNTSEWHADVNNRLCLVYTHC